jgi:hypothetical protein
MFQELNNAIIDNHLVSIEEPLNTILLELHNNIKLLDKRITTIEDDKDEDQPFTHPCLNYDTHDNANHISYTYHDEEIAEANSFHDEQ